MENVIEISNELSTKLRIAAEKNKRTIEEQLDHWALIGKAADKHLTEEEIDDVLSGKARIALTSI